VGEGTTPGGPPLPLFTVPALPETGRPEQFLIDLYERTYRNTPYKAAQRHRWALHDARQALLEGDQRRAEHSTRTAAAIQAVLDKQVRCRRCGRHLEKPESVARGIGPECHGKPL
jgi:hypothetical protein